MALRLQTIEMGIYDIDLTFVFKLATDGVLNNWAALKTFINRYKVTVFLC